MLDNVNYKVKSVERNIMGLYPTENLLFPLISPIKPFSKLLKKKKIKANSDKA